ncbi:MAG: transcriptional activator RfaH [Akkermansiaceae bacterium]|nr:transcriptional activator RfaH [Akkermansiaceae bacterium]NNM28868.1 transcriptional activator RfaH [Akkermansiaceae bacterium]
MSAAEHDDREWYCLRTQVKREQLALAALREFEDVEALCPQLRYRKVTRRGKIWWVEPLFPGYLLAKFSLERQMRAVTYAKGVSRVLQFGEHVPSVPGKFIEELRVELSRQESEDGTILVQPAVEPGDEVELAEGPLQGLTGRVLEVCPAEERVRIFIEFLGQEQPVDVDLFSLLLPKHPAPGRPEMEP